MPIYSHQICITTLQIVITNYSRQQRLWLYYEKALKLNPRDEDVLFNLQLVQLQLVDKLAEVPQTFYQKWADGLKNLRSIDQWAKLGLLFSFVFCVFFMIFLFTNTYKLKKNGV